MKRGFKLLVKQNLALFKDIWELLNKKQTTVNKLIELEIAIVCLYRAQAFIDCKVPLIENAKLTLEKSRPCIPKNSKDAVMMYRVNFRLQPISAYKSRKCEARRGMVLRIVSGNTKIVVRILFSYPNHCFKCAVFSAALKLRRATITY